MKPHLLCFTAWIAGSIPLLHAQVTSVDCNLMGLVVNVGSQPTMLSLYHPGGYLTWPGNENVMDWLFTDSEGNVVHDTTLVDENHVSFGHSVPITDTIFVSVLLTNDSAVLNGNSVVCLIEDYVTWVEEEIIPGTFMGSWTLGGSTGIDMGGLDGWAFAAGNEAPKRLIAIVDAAGRTVNPRPNQLVFFIYDDGSVEKKFMLD